MWLPAALKVSPVSPAGDPGVTKYVMAAPAGPSVRQNDRDPGLTSHPRLPSSILSNQLTP